MTDTREYPRPVEGVAKAIYDKPSTFDGDPIGYHISESWSLDNLRDQPEMRAHVMTMCEDAARAAIDYLKANHLINDAGLDLLRAEEASHKEKAE